MPFNRIGNYACKMLNWWRPTRNTVESLFNQKQHKQKSSIWPIHNGAAAEQKSLITSSTCCDLTCNPTHTYFRTEIPSKSNMQRAFSAHGTITCTQHRDKHRWPIRWSGFETCGETQTSVWKTSRPSWKKSKRYMATRRENSMWQWSVWSISIKERMNQWESTPIESKKIGEQRDGSCRIRRTITKSLGADYDQDLSPGSSCWPQRMESLTVRQSFSTALPIQKSSRTATSPNSSSHINSKSSQENHFTKAARNTTFDHPYPSRPKDQSPTSVSRTRMSNAIFCLGSRRSSTKLRSWKENAYTVGYPNIKHSGARNIHVPTSPKTLLTQETENKSNTSAP